MRKKATLLLHGTLLLLILGYTSLKGQCPANISLFERSNTPATCPSNGAFTIGSNCAHGDLKYQVLDGPSGVSLQAQDDSSYSSLLPGTYKVKAYCINAPNISETITINIDNQYTKLSDFSTSLTTTPCGVGTLIFNGTTGGRSPFKYSVIQSSNPGYNDNQSQYSGNTTFTPLNTGVYQARVKDYCGVMSTQTVEVLPGLPGVNLLMGISSLPCAENSFQFNIITGKNPIDGSDVNLTPYLASGGLTLKVYEADNSCNKMGTTPLTTFNYTSVGNGYFNVPIVSSTQYYVEVTNSCGITTHQCAGGAGLKPNMNISMVSVGCNESGSPAIMQFKNVYEYMVRYPITVTIKNITTNTVVAGFPRSFSSTTQFNNYLASLSLTHANYEVQVTDQCGKLVLDNTYNDVTGAGTPSVHLTSTYPMCSNQTGALGLVLDIGGYLPDLANAISVVIIEGPSNVNVPGYKESAGSYSWDNMLPGNYKIRVTTSCGTYDIPYTATFTGGLQRNIRAVATSYCTGNGKVEIDATNTYYRNGAGTVSYDLINADNNMVVASNLSGQFANLPSGNYKINMVILNYCEGNGEKYSISSNTVTVTPAGAPPMITKKLGVVCEDANGVPTGTGTAYLETAGGTPMTMEYRIHTGNDNDSWTPITTNAQAIEKITGLIPNVTYDVRVSVCGKNYPTEVTIGQLSPVRVNNTAQPCEGQDYTLSVPEMPGASYVWKNESGLTLSTSYNFPIPNYQASFDGTYTCTVTFDGCVVRIATITLNSTLCGQQILPINITSFTTVNKNCIPYLTWTTEYKETDKEFVVEMSENGTDFIAVKQVLATYGIQKYSYAESYPVSNDRYYRLKLVDMDGSYIYSKVIKVKACDNISTPAFSLRPNPAVSGTSTTVVYNGSDVSGHFSIINMAGQVVYTGKEVIMGLHQNNNILPLQQFNHGVYIVIFTTNDGQIIYRQKLVVQ